MEQVSQTSDYYCKKFSNIIMDTRPLFTAGSNTDAYLQHRDSQLKLINQYEIEITKYLNVAGITEWAQIHAYIQRIDVKMESFMESDSKHDSVHHAVQIAQDILTSSSSSYSDHFATPKEKPAYMKEQTIQFWSLDFKHYMHSIITSLRLVLVRRRQ